MFAILISVMIFPGQEPKVIAMPFVMTMENCQKQIADRADESKSEITVDGGNA